MPEMIFIILAKNFPAPLSKDVRAVTLLGNLSGDNQICFIFCICFYNFIESFFWSKHIFRLRTLVIYKHRFITSGIVFIDSAAQCFPNNVCTISTSLQNNLIAYFIDNCFYKNIKISYNLCLITGCINVICNFLIKRTTNHNFL